VNRDGAGRLKTVGRAMLLRLRKKETLRELAARSGVSRKTLCALSTGQNETPTLEIAFALQKRLKIPADSWLEPSATKATIVDTAAATTTEGRSPAAE
jgi:transcriptional regulator with XRE-family HTH domain